jgi:hypothetical protein
MVEIVQHHKMMVLTDIITLTLDNERDLKMVNDDASYAAKPFNHHVHNLKPDLLLYSQKCFSLSNILDKEDVLNMTRTELYDNWDTTIIY